MQDELRAEGEQAAEILAPAAAEPGRKFEAGAGRGWAQAPATYGLIAVNVLVLLLMAVRGISLVAPRPDQLLHWGAEFGPAVLLGDQWWRLGSAAFLHVGLLHLLTNMWCLWNLGLLGEPLLGAAGMVGAYLLTGVAGNLLSVAWRPGLGGGEPAIGAGASGAIFGLAGVLIVLLRSPYLPLPEAERKGLRKNVITFAVLNFVLAFGVNAGHFGVRFDNSAHLGGFLAGLLLALPLVPRLGAPPELFRRRRWVAMSGAALLLVLLCVGVRAYFLG